MEKEQEKSLRYNPEGRRLIMSKLAGYKEGNMLQDIRKNTLMNKKNL